MLRFDAAAYTWAATSNTIATECHLRPIKDSDVEALPAELKAALRKHKRPMSGAGTEKR